MAAGTVSTADVGGEGIGAELAGETYRIMRHLARGPQNERYLLTRVYGLGFDKQTEQEVMAAMGLTPADFDTLHKRALRNLRAAQRGD